jgi:WASH complex subunit strumpellin
VLKEIEEIQTHKMVAIPTRFEAKDLKNFAQLDLRFDLSRLTHQVSVFTEGVLVMQRTLLGVIHVEPRQILQEGLRRELVRLTANAMHQNLSFRDMTQDEIYSRVSSLSAQLDGLKRSIEYLQDYIGIAGLQMYQQELSRVINYNTEQESNQYLKKKVFDSASRYQSREVPIPRLTSINDGTGAVNFMGQIMSALMFLTDSSRTIYAPECSAWFLHSAPDEKRPIPTSEACGVRTFNLLERSLGVIGLRGLDRLFAFRTVHEFNLFLKFYQQDVHPFRTLLDQVRTALFPEYSSVADASKLYAGAMKKVENMMLPLLKHIRRIGQSQLIRRQIANVLQFGCKLDASLLSQALDTFNRGLMNDIRKHYHAPDKHPYPGSENPLLFETAILLDATGMNDPCNKIYITTQPLEGLPVLLFLFLMTYLPKLEYDINFGTLIRKKGAYPLDGTPLAVGLACMLRQFHPAVTRKLISYLGQFVRTTIQGVFTDVDTKAVDIPAEAINTLIFMEQLCRYASVPRSVVHAYVPPYIFDNLNLPVKK